MSTGTPLPTLALAATTGPNQEGRRAVASRAKTLTYLGLGWHVLEAAVAIVAGVLAGSVALVGFGADSVIEVAAGVVVLWSRAGV
jgi:divalent metal cation (Fe/Co/Zn/Cd) transporter